MHQMLLLFFFLLCVTFFNVNFIASFQTQFMCTEIIKFNTLLYCRIKQINKM